MGDEVYPSLGTSCPQLHEGKLCPACNGGWFSWGLCLGLGTGERGEVTSGEGDVVTLDKFLNIKYVTSLTSQTGIIV